MKGRWVRAHDRRPLLDSKPWVAYTAHTEGNDHFATQREAKLHARKRLRELLKATEALR